MSNDPQLSSMKQCGAVWQQGGSKCICRLPKEHRNPHGWWWNELPAEPIDLERLAEAWGNVMDGRRIGEGLNAVRIGRDTTTASDWLDIMVEYRALGDSA